MWKCLFTFWNMKERRQMVHRILCVVTIEAHTCFSKSLRSTITATTKKRENNMPKIISNQMYKQKKEKKTFFNWMWKFFDCKIIAWWLSLEFKLKYVLLFFPNVLLNLWIGIFSCFFNVNQYHPFQYYFSTFQNRKTDRSNKKRFNMFI